MLWDHLHIYNPLLTETLLCSTWLHEPCRVNHPTNHPSPIPSYVWVTFRCSYQVPSSLSFNEFNGQDSSPFQRIYSTCGLLCKKRLLCKALKSGCWSSFISLDRLPRNSQHSEALSTQEQIFPRGGPSAGCDGGTGSIRAGKKDIKKRLQAEKASLDFYDHN